MRQIFILVTLITLSLQAFARTEYPSRPDGRLTPGELCHTPDTYRYPERIAYCERDVSTDQKDQIFESYRRLGYRLNPAHRSSYKIDHYIPLCAGGSNDNENLWPQHRSVYILTDTLEKLACERLAMGVISQREVVSLIMTAKNDHSKIESVRREISNRR